MSGEKPFAFRAESVIEENHLGVFENLTQAVAALRVNELCSGPSDIAMYACFGVGVEAKVPAEWISEPTVCTREQAVAAVQSRIALITQARNQGDAEGAKRLESLGIRRYGGPVDLPSDTQVENYIRTRPRQWCSNADIRLKESVMTLWFLQSFTTDPSIESSTMISAPDERLYDKDFYLWTHRMGQLVRSGKWEELDRENVAEELESIGRGEQSRARRRFSSIVEHLVRWWAQPGRRCGSWDSHIVNRRFQLQDILEMSPSLREYLDSQLNKLYSKAVEDAVRKVGLIKNPFPTVCPFSIEQLIDPDFYLPDPLPKDLG